jgi:hypothetical protein
MDDELNEGEMVYLNLNLAKVAGVLHPRRPKGLRLHPGRVWHHFHQERHRIMRIIEKDAKTPPEQIFVHGCPQKALVEHVVAVALQAASKPPKMGKGRKQEPLLRFDRMLDIICFLRAFIRELSRWPVS